MSAMPRPISDLRELGHNDRLQVNGRSLDVQTEVVGQGPWEVRSMVIEAGRVIHTSRGSLPATITDVERAAQEVRAQHERVMRKVGQGELT